MWSAWAKGSVSRPDPAAAPLMEADTTRRLAVKVIGFQRLLPKCSIRVNRALHARIRMAPSPQNPPMRQIQMLTIVGVVPNVRGDETGEQECDEYKNRSQILSVGVKEPWGCSSLLTDEENARHYPRQGEGESDATHRHERIVAQSHEEGFREKTCSGWFCCCDFRKKKEAFGL